ncbi:MAG TPA: hypothetical protein VG894_00655 [Bauldia sp.]|nr:hypothetical protein [Bauldia sp.]
MTKRAPPAKSTAPKKKPAVAKPAAPAKSPVSGKPRRTIPVHALADERVHLALAQLGRLRQGQLKTLCGKVAVSELSPFALAGPKAERCRTCFGMLDAEGQYRPA